MRTASGLGGGRGHFVSALGSSLASLHIAHDQHQLVVIMSPPRPCKRLGGMIAGAGEGFRGTCAFHIVSTLWRFYLSYTLYARARVCKRETVLGNKFWMRAKASTISARRETVQGRRATLTTQIWRYRS